MKCFCFRFESSQSLTAWIFGVWFLLASYVPQATPSYASPRSTTAPWPASTSSTLTPWTQSRSQTPASQSHHGHHCIQTPSPTLTASAPKSTREARCHLEHFQWTRVAWIGWDGGSLRCCRGWPAVTSVGISSLGCRELWIWSTWSIASRSGLFCLFRRRAGCGWNCLAMTLLRWVFLPCSFGSFARGCKCGTLGGSGKECRRLRTWVHRAPSFKSTDLQANSPASTQEVTFGKCQVDSRLLCATLWYLEAKTYSVRISPGGRTCWTGCLQTFLHFGC